MGNCNILIVTVIYNQRIEDTNIFKSLLSEDDYVFIYDNSPKPQDIKRLPSNWIYISDTSNSGLSKAYNKAADYAQTQGIEWILIADQDTLFPHNAIDIYRMNIKLHGDIHMFLPKVRTVRNLYISPVKTVGYMPRPSRFTPDSKISLKKHAVINSGTLVSTEAFKSCGGYNENVFLDFSDFQFMERFAFRYQFAYVLNMECIQDLSTFSDSTEKKISRFRLFCKSLSGYQSLRKFGRLQITAVVAKRALKLCIATRSLKPVAIMAKNYKPKNASRNNH